MSTETLIVILCFVAFIAFIWGVLIMTGILLAGLGIQWVIKHVAGCECQTNKRQIPNTWNNFQ